MVMLVQSVLVVELHWLPEAEQALVPAVEESAAQMMQNCKTTLFSCKHAGFKGGDSSPPYCCYGRLLIIIFWKP